MSNIGPVVSRHGLVRHGVVNHATAYWNLSATTLYEHTISGGHGRLAPGGALAVLTGQHTGRSPRDKFIVKEPRLRE